MKCRVCGQQAVISLRSYHTALCEQDFINFLERRVYSTINKYKLIEPGEKSIVAVSGGKDSLAIWHILNKLGYNPDGVYINLGIGEYSEISLSRVKEMAKRIGKKVFIFSLKSVFSKEISELSRIIRRAPCSACGTIKRYVMNRICLEKGYSVLVTGHNLDDEASALLGNFLYWKNDYLWKKNIILEATGGHLSKKVKPFFLCSEREVAAYAIMSGIDYVYDECPYSVKASSLAYKELLNKIEERSPGTKLMFLKGYMKHSKEISKNTRAGKPGFCSICGYPSFSPVCNFCRILERFGTGAQFHFEEHDPTVLTEIDN